MSNLVRQCLLVWSVGLSSGSNFDVELHLLLFALVSIFLTILGTVHNVKIKTIHQINWLHEFEPNDHFARVWVTEDTSDHPQGTNLPHIQVVMGFEKNLNEISALLQLGNQLYRLDILD